MVVWEWGKGVSVSVWRDEKSNKKIFGVTDMFIILIVMMIS